MSPVGANNGHSSQVCLRITSSITYQLTNLYGHYGIQLIQTFGFHLIALGMFC